MSADIMKHLLQDFGKTIGIAELQLDNEARCNLLFDDIGVSFELAPKEESVYLYAMLGVAPSTGLEPIYTQLLDANYIFKGTQGATIGVEASSNSIVLIREERLENMQLSRFEATVKAFVDLAESWREKLNELTVEAPAGDDGSSWNMAPDSFSLKV